MVGSSSGAVSNANRVSRPGNTTRAMTRAAGVASARASAVTTTARIALLRSAPISPGW